LFVASSSAQATTGDLYYSFASIDGTYNIGMAGPGGTNANNTFIPLGTADCVNNVITDPTYVYWDDSCSENIGRANLDGTNVIPDYITTGNTCFPGGLAINSTDIYWESTGCANGSIGRAALDGTGANNDFISTGSNTNPFYVAVDDNYVYWVDSNTNTIGRANLDGTNVTPGWLAPTGIGCMTGLAVDSTNIYWADSCNNAIGSAPSDGSNLTPPTSFLITPCPGGLVVASTNIYWQNFCDSTFAEAPIDGSTAPQTLLTISGGTSAADNSLSVVPAAQAPINTVQPALSNTSPQVGTEISTTNGTWINDPTSFTYQWKDCDTGLTPGIIKPAKGPICHSIAGATNQTYTITSSDVGSLVTVLITASNTGGNGFSQPPFTDVIPAVPVVPPVVTPPVVTPPVVVTPPTNNIPVITPSLVAPFLVTKLTFHKVFRVHHVVTVNAGKWAGSGPLKYAYQWQTKTRKGFKNIKGATRAKYRLTARNRKVRVIVTVTGPGGKASKVSAAHSVRK
jgi:hypothetical protein